MQTTITLGSISTGTIAKGPSQGKKFTKSEGAIAHFGNGDKAVTVMAFADQRDSVAKLLKKGRKVTVTAVWEGRNLLKILGPAQPTQEAAQG